MDELYRIKLRRDTSENWNTENPILESGEPCIDTTLNRLKIGNGEHWNDTDWFAYSIEEIIEMIPDVQEALADYYTKDEVDSIINQLNIPTKTSDLTNDSNFATQDYVDQHTPENVVLYTPQVLTEEQKSQARSNIGAGQSGFSGDYNDLTNKPFIPSKTSDLTNDSGFISQETEPAFNASAAKNITSQDITNWDNKSDFSGNYSDLAGKPTIPTKTSDLTNDSDFATTSYVDQHTPESVVLYTQQSLTEEQKSQARSNIGAGESGFSGDYNDLTNKPFIPSKTSDLTNDSGFITDYTETDPVFTASPAHSITSQDITNWNAKSDFSGSYNDLTNKPSIPTKTSDLTNDSGFITGADWDDITNKPTFATVATSGSYSDLSNTPSIPTKTSDLTNDSGYITTETDPVFTASPAHGITSSDITNWNGKSDFSGSYNDLTDKPTIGATDGDTTLAFGQRSSIATVNGVDIHVTMPNAQSFSQEQADWNQTDNTQVDYIKNKPTIPTVPTNVSAFTNDAGYLTTETEPAFNASAAKDITSSDITNWNNKSDFSGSYNDLTDKPSIPAAQVNSDWDANSGVAQILNKPTLSTVATSGSYNDLTDKPTIPTVPTINGSRTIDVATSGDTKTISRKVLSQTITSAATTLAVASNTIYTFTNDVTSLNLSSLPTDDYFESLLIFHTDVNNIQITLPASAVVYGSTTLKGSKDYIIAIKNNQVAIALQGDAEIDWSNIENKPTFATVATSGSYNDLTNKPSLATVATSGSYNDLSNTPTIPAAQVNSDWNASSGVAEILNKPNLATVATSGSYNDLSNTPTIPTVNNNTITLTQGGVTKGTFTLNQSSDATIAFDAGGGSSEYLPVNRITNYAKLQNGYMYFVIKDGYNNYIELAGLNITSTTQANTVSIYFLMESTDSYPFHNCLVTFQKLNNTTTYHVEDYYFMFGMDSAPSSTETIDGVSYRYVGWTTERSSMEYFPQGSGSTPSYYGTFAPKANYLGNMALYTNTWMTNSANNVNIWRVQFNAFYDVLDSNGWFWNYKGKYVPPASEDVDGIIEHPNVSPESLAYRKITYTDPDSSTSVTDFMASYPYAAKINTTPLTITNTSSHDISFGVIGNYVNNSQNDTYSMLVKKMHIYGAYDDEWGSTETGWLPDSVYTYNSNMYKWAITLKSGESYKFYFDCFLNKQDDGMGYISYNVIAPAFGVANDSDLSYITVSGNIMSLFYGMEFTGYETNVPEWILDYDRDNQYAIQTQYMYYWLSTLTTYSDFSLNYVNDYEPTKTSGYNFPNFFNSISSSSYSARRTAICNALYTNPTYSGQTALVIPRYIVRGNDQSYTIWTGTQAEYDALQTKYNNVVYLIKAS